MAEAPLSPVAALRAIDLHPSDIAAAAAAAALLNENSNTASTDATSMDATYTHGTVGLGIGCPATPHLQLKLPDLSSSSSDSEGEELNQQFDEAVGTAAGTANAAGDVTSGRVASPPPNCAICLGRCKNKCFTDSCMHQFCFKCLCEWSKVKPECPLCKQTFKSIIHNVKSIDQFEEYHVQPPTVQIPHHRPIEVTYGQLPYIVDGVVLNGRNDYEISVANWDAPRAAHRIVRAGRTIFFPSAFAGGSSGASSSAGNSSAQSNSNVGGGSTGNVQNQFIHRGELLDMYRQEYPDAIASSGTLSQLWRRYVYDRKLYALPVCDITGRYRESNARFYRENPAQVSRLMPWINRDIVCLLRNTEHDVTAVLEVIHTFLSVLNILSPTFRRRIQPYLGTNTTHFIHELNNFARSPYDMIGYDRSVQYSPQTAEEIIIEFSSSSASSDEENVNVIDVSSSSRTAAEQQTRTRIVRMRDTQAATETAPPQATQSSSSSSSRGDYRVQSRSANSSNQPPMVNLLSFTISTTSEGVEAPGVTVAVSGRGTQSTAINLTTHNRASEVIIDLDETELDATLGGDGENNAATATTATAMQTLLNTTERNITENIELTSSSSDECEFVLERKPPHLRTPEMVSLNSDSDSDVVFVDESRQAAASLLRLSKFNSSSDEDAAADDGFNDDAAAASTSHKTNDKSAARSSIADAVKQEPEVYNVGASTSAGIRSTGLKRRQKSLDAEKRIMSRRQPPNKLKDCIGIIPLRQRRGKVIGSESSPTSSDSTSTSSDNSSTSDSDYACDFEKKRKRTKLAKRKNLEKNVRRAAATATATVPKVTVSTTTVRKAARATEKAKTTRVCNKRTLAQSSKSVRQSSKTTKRPKLGDALKSTMPPATCNNANYTSDDDEDEQLNLRALERRIHEKHRQKYNNMYELTTTAHRAEAANDTEQRRCTASSSEFITPNDAEEVAVSTMLSTEATHDYCLPTTSVTETTTATLTNISTNVMQTRDNDDDNIDVVESPASPETTAAAETIDDRMHEERKSNVPPQLFSESSVSSASSASSSASSTTSTTSRSLTSSAEESDSNQMHTHTVSNSSTYYFKFDQNESNSDGANVSSTMKLTQAQVEHNTGNDVAEHNAEEEDNEDDEQTALAAALADFANAAHTFTTTIGSTPNSVLTFDNEDDDNENDDDDVSNGSSNFM